MLELVDARSKEHIAIARALFLEYASALDFDLCFQDFDEELVELPGEYVEPVGAILLAFDDCRPAGCVALRGITPEVCEMKRLYVREEFRTRGIGRKLAEAIISKARDMGYHLMKLDTVPTMNEAITLYRSLGFGVTERYRYNPIEGTLYMELKLM